MWAIRIPSLVGKLEQLAVKSAPMMGTIGARLRALGVTAGSTAAELITWAKANKGNAALMVATVASLGMDVMDLFEDGDEVGKAEVRKIATGEAALASVSLLNKASEASTALKGLNLGSRGDRDFVEEVLAYAVRQFGSPKAALRAHGMMQAFFELPADVVAAELKV